MDLIDRLRNPRWLTVEGEERRRLDEGEVIAAMREAATEIEHLRALAGAVSKGESFGDMKKRSKLGLTWPNAESK